MKTICRLFIPFFLVFGFNLSPFAQSCESMNIQAVADIPSVCAEITMTMLQDQMGRPFLYVANKSAGLKIYDISDPAEPVFVKTIPIVEFGDLHVMSLHQTGEYLFLALGNFFGAGEEAGLAVIDVMDPNEVFVTDFWKDDSPGSGAGIVKTEGNYAYLGAMGEGLLVFDVLDKNNIALISQFVPDISYPDPNPDPAKYNARGMEVKNDRVYLCYDAGGLRIIDVADKLAPVEIGHYSNSDLNMLPRAYNNLVLDLPYVYVAIDYCGLEVLDISDPAQISLVGWWNPWNCQSNPLNWFSSPGHTNEIGYDKDCQHLFLSSGKSDLHVLDISDPSQPDSCNYFGGVDNNIGTWGVSIFDNKIFLSYICAFIPFASNWTGIKILEYDNNCVNNISENTVPKMEIYPNPFSDIFNIKLQKNNIYDLAVFNANGIKIYTAKNQSYSDLIKIDFSEYENGIYYLTLFTGNEMMIEKIIKIVKK